MQPARSYRWLTLCLLATAALAGCAEPYFTNKIDYVYFNEVEGKYSPTDPEDNPVIPPGQPRTVLDPAGDRETWELSLENVKQLALEKNPRIALVAYQPGVVGTDIETQLSTFDPFFEIGGGWARTDQQTNSVLETGSFTGPASFKTNTFGAPVGAGPYGYNLTTGAETSLFNPSVRQSSSLIPGTNLVEISKLNATGGLSRVGYGLDYQLADPAGFNVVNPYWRSRLNFRLDQPLLQGAGVEYNRAPILIARANHSQAIQNFETEVRTLLRDIELAYWQLYYSYQDLYASDVGLKQALVTWQKEKNKQEVGTASAPDVAQAREQYELFRGTRNEALNRVLAAERELRNLLGLPPDDRHQLIPQDEPVRAKYEPNWEVGVSEALELRPELSGQRFAIRAAELELMRQKNALKPDLTFSAVYEVTGLDDEFDQSINELKKNHYQDWYLGVRYRRQVGERTAHAGVRRAQLSLSQQRAGLRTLEHAILHELHAAYQDLAFAYRQIQIQGDRRIAAADLLNAREQFYRQGRATVDILLEAQRAFSNALRDEALASAQYNQALVRWEFAKGSILQNDNVYISEQSICRADPKMIHERAWQMRHAVNLPLPEGRKLHGEIEVCPDGRGALYQTGFWREGDSKPSVAASSNSIPTSVPPSLPSIESTLPPADVENSREGELDSLPMLPAPTPPPRRRIPSPDNPDADAPSPREPLPSKELPPLENINNPNIPGLPPRDEAMESNAGPSRVTTSVGTTSSSKSPMPPPPLESAEILDLQEIPAFPGLSGEQPRRGNDRSKSSNGLGPIEQLGFVKMTSAGEVSPFGQSSLQDGESKRPSAIEAPRGLAISWDQWSRPKTFIFLGIATFLAIFAALVGWMFWDFRRS